MWSKGALEGWGSSLGPQQAPQGWVGKGNARRVPPWSSKPPRVPWGVETPPLSQPPLRGTGPVWPPLLFPAHSPPCPTLSLGGSSRLLGCQGPPPVSGRYPSRGETWTLCPPTPPSWHPQILSVYFLQTRTFFYISTIQLSTLGNYHWLITAVYSTKPVQALPIARKYVL